MSKPNPKQSGKVLSMHERLHEVANDAAKSQAVQAHTPNGATEPTSYRKTPMQRMLVAPLKSVQLPALFGKDGRLRRIPTASLAGETISLASGIIANSRVAQAGVNVIVRDDPQGAHPTGLTGTVAMRVVPASMRNVNAARFGSVADGDDVPVSSWPVESAELDWDSDSITKAVRFSIPRSERRSLNPELIFAEISAALTMGIARAADDLVLAAINAASPGVYSLPLVAAADVKFGELRGLIGTNGDGASVAADGSLRASGIGAELTPDMEETIVGAWDRATVVIGGDIRVYFERLNINGDLAVTAWAEMLALIPESNKFWTVA